MTDRELLELAAMAARIRVCWHDGDEVPRHMDLTAPPRIYWNPLTEDGDALRLAVRLNLHMVPLSFLVPAAHSVKVGIADWDGIEEPANGDPYAATRRAIVRAAAEIGKQMLAAKQEGDSNG